MLDRKSKQLGKNGTSDALLMVNMIGLGKLGRSEARLRWEAKDQREELIG
jgi:hypothetical protein